MRCRVGFIDLIVEQSGEREPLRNRTRQNETFGHGARRECMRGSNEEVFMHLKHLALAAQDVGASSHFYAAYFGFREGPGRGLMVGADGVRLAIHETTAPVHPPDLLHFGFDVETNDDVWSLWRRMNQDGITLQGEPTKHMGSLVFWCRDPAGYLVEVRAVGQRTRDPET